MGRTIDWHVEPAGYEYQEFGMNAAYAAILGDWSVPDYDDSAGAATDVVFSGYGAVLPIPSGYSISPYGDYNSFLEVGNSGSYSSTNRR